MSARIEEWLGRMREIRPGGPAVRVTASERGRDLGWVFPIDDATDVRQLAESIDATCSDAGVSCCELRAFNGEAQWVGQLQHKARPAAEIVPSGAQLTIPAGVEDVVQHALQTSRSFAGLSFKAIIKNHELALQMVDRLDRQVTALTRENADLRQRLSDRWELTDKLHSHQLDDDLARDKAQRQGRIAETLVHAAMARLFGQATPEGQTVQTRLTVAFLRSLNEDQIQKIVAVLSEDQRIALFELVQAVGNSRPATGAGSQSEAHAVAASPAAASPAATNTGTVP
jgi:hypothetical protein